MTNLKSFDFTDAQEKLLDLLSRFKYCLFYGGSRSGKTFAIICAIVYRALKYPGSNHIILRKRFNHIKLSIWRQTLPNVLKIAFPNAIVKRNDTDYFIEFQNKSQIWIGGTDDKERIEKILGSEWDTVFLNEASQLSYDIFDMFKTRLNPSAGCPPLYIVDENPPSKSHWTHVVFLQKKDFESKQELSFKEQYCYLKLSPRDNKENLSEGYIETLESMSESKKRRFLYGEFGDDSEGALWKRNWIYDNRITSLPDKLLRVVVGVDPAVTGTDKSDDTGIVVAAKYKIGTVDHYCVLDDRTYSGGVTGWGAEVCKAYEDHKADRVIGESNQGGDLVEMNIRNYNKNISFESVRATRGKAVRAEPIADLYRRGLVHHYGEFTDLEDEMCSWSPASDESPDRMDALVWALSYLSGISNGGVIKMTGW